MAPCVRCAAWWARAGLTEARVEELAEKYRAPAPPPAPVSDDAAEWPDLAAPAPGPGRSEPAGNGAPSEEEFPALGGSARASAPASSDGGAGVSHASSAATLASEREPAQHAQHGDDADDGGTRVNGGAREPKEPHQASNGSIASVDAGAAGASGGKEEEEEDIDLGPGMFDEDAAGLLSAPAQQRGGSVADAVAPWGGYGGPARKKGFKLKSAPQRCQLETAPSCAVMVSGQAPRAWPAWVLTAFSVVSLMMHQPPADAVAPWGGYGGPARKKGFKLKSAPPSVAGCTAPPWAVMVSVRTPRA